MNHSLLVITNLVADKKQKNLIMYRQVRHFAATPRHPCGPHPAGALGTRLHPTRTQSWPLWGNFAGGMATPYARTRGPECAVLGHFWQFSLTR